MNNIMDDIPYRNVAQSTTGAEELVKMGKCTSKTKLLPAIYAARRFILRRGRRSRIERRIYQNLRDFMISQEYPEVVTGLIVSALVSDTPMPREGKLIDAYYARRTARPSQIEGDTSYLSPTFLWLLKIIEEVEEDFPMSISSSDLFQVSSRPSSVDPSRIVLPRRLSYFIEKRILKKFTDAPRPVREGRLPVPKMKEFEVVDKLLNDYNRRVIDEQKK